MRPVVCDSRSPMVVVDDSLLAGNEKGRSIATFHWPDLLTISSGRSIVGSSSAIKSPLSEPTIENIKMCFGLISAREQEIAKEAGVELNEKPHFTDKAVTSNVVSLDTLKLTITSTETIDPNEEGFE